VDNEKTHYQIAVCGKLDEAWSDWFEGMEIETARGSNGAVVTLLTGAVADQSALRGIVCRLWDLNLALISITQIEKGRN
jgi:hypothetical protein